MRFEEAMKAIREGKKVRRKSWDNEIVYIKMSNYMGQTEIIDQYFIDGKKELALCIMGYDILADDWEIVEEKPHPKLVTHCKVENTHCDEEGSGALFSRMNNQLYCYANVDDGIDLTGREIRITVETVD